MSLKPCPYCGFILDVDSRPAVDLSGSALTAGAPAVVCLSCYMRGPRYDRDGAKWNQLPREEIDEREPDEMPERHPIEENPSYRQSMKDAGRGHLLP